jgi:hypothetical protein
MVPTGNENAFVYVRVQRRDGTFEPIQALDAVREPGVGDFVWLSDERRVEIRGSERTADGRLSYLIAVDAPPPGHQPRPSDSSVLSTWFDSPLGIAIEITAAAAERIIARGGRLYLWQEEVGAWLADHASFDEPAIPAFRRIPAGLVTLLIDARVTLPRRLRVSAVRVVPGRVRVEWDGQTWGARGGGSNSG